MELTSNNKVEEFKDFKPTYHERKLDICGICQKKYNVGDRIPRILVNCGHTYCTSCLNNFYKNNKIKCPFCKKIVKHLDNVETLPLNLPIFSEIVKSDQKVNSFIDTKSNNSFISKCDHHSHKQKHFFCSYHNTNFCRECIKQFHKDDNCCIVDLFDIHKLFLINEENTMKNEQIVKIKKKEKELIKNKKENNEI